MVEKIAFENGRISNFKGLKILTLDRVILHTFVHHSSTSIYMPNFIEIEEIFCGPTDIHTHARTDGHLRPALLSRLCQRVDLKNDNQNGVDSATRSVQCKTKEKRLQYS